MIIFCRAKAAKDQGYDLDVDEHANESHILAAKVFNSRSGSTKLATEVMRLALVM